MASGNNEAAQAVADKENSAADKESTIFNQKEGKTVRENRVDTKEKRQMWWGYAAPAVAAQVGIRNGADQPCCLSAAKTSITPFSLYIFIRTVGRLNIFLVDRIPGLVYPVSLV